MRAASPFPIAFYNLQFVLFCFVLFFLFFFLFVFLFSFPGFIAKKMPSIRIYSATQMKLYNLWDLFATSISFISFRVITRGH